MGAWFREPCSISGLCPVATLRVHLIYYTVLFLCHQDPKGQNQAAWIAASKTMKQNTTSLLPRCVFLKYFVPVLGHGAEWPWMSSVLSNRRCFPAPGPSCVHLVRAGSVDFPGSRSDGTVPFCGWCSNCGCGPLTLGPPESPLAPQNAESRLHFCHA